MGLPGRSFPPNNLSGLLTPGVKWLLIANGAIFVFTFFAFHFGGLSFQFLKLIPADFLGGYLWQPFTYMFLHSLGGFSHILFNLLSLVFTGPLIETALGTKRFLQYFFYCGMGAGLFVVAASFPFGTMDVATLGCSGALFGLLSAYWLKFPDLLFYGIIPAKYVAMILAAVSFMGTIGFREQGISYVAHLGGMVVGFALIKFGWWDTRRPAKRGQSAFSFNPVTMVKNAIQDWKMKRRRKQFEVYMRNQNRRDLQ